MHDLIERAGALGLKVVYRDLGRRHGELHTSGIVYINHRRTEARQRLTLAHEMGHWWHGHDWTRDHDRERDEAQADRWAAAALITPDAYCSAERLVGAHPGAIARELGVTRRIVELRRESLERDARILATVEAWRADAWAN